MTVGPTEVIAAPTEVVAKPVSAPAAEPESPPAPTAKARGGTQRTAIAVAAVVAAAPVGLAVLVVVRLQGESPKHPHGGRATSSLASSPAPAPAASTPGIKLSSQITDQSGVLGALEYDAVNRAVTKLYNGRGTRLWVVYVNNFGGIKPFRWAKDTMRANNFTDSDAILAVATDEPAFSFRVHNAIITGKAIDLEMIRRDRIAPAVFRHEWARAAIAAANGLDVAPS